MPTLVKKDGHEERTITVRSLAFGVAKNGARYARVQDDRGVLYFAWNGVVDRLEEGAVYRAVIDASGDRLRLVHVEPLPPSHLPPQPSAPAPIPAPVARDSGTADRPRSGVSELRHGEGLDPGLASRDRELASIKQTCVKAACELYAGSGDVDGALRAAGALLAWVLG
jgi:hypothetical protein